MLRVACSRRFGSSRPRQRSNRLQKYGIGAVYAYGAISAIELPIFLAIVHYSGTDWMQDVELRVRSILGASTNVDDTWIKKAQENKGGTIAAEIASVFVLHKLFIIVRLPLSVALAPFASKTLKRGSMQPASVQPQSVSSEARPRTRGQHRNFGTPPNKRNKWLSWFF